MKLLKIAAAALLVTAAAACSSSKSETDAVVTDSIAETAADPATDPATDPAEATEGDVVEVFNNESKAEPQGKPLVIDFSATWCGPCQQFKPTFHKVAEKYAAKARFATADVDICHDLAQKYDIQSIPFILILNPDGSKASFMGKMSESEFEAFLDKNMK